MLHGVVVLIVLDRVCSIFLVRVQMHTVEVAEEYLRERTIAARFMALVSWEVMRRSVQPVITLDFEVAFVADGLI